MDRLPLELEYTYWCDTLFFSGKNKSLNKEKSRISETKHWHVSGLFQNVINPQAILQIWFLGLPTRAKSVVPKSRDSVLQVATRI